MSQQDIQTDIGSTKQDCKIAGAVEVENGDEELRRDAARKRCATCPPAPGHGPALLAAELNDPLIRSQSENISRYKRVLPRVLDDQSKPAQGNDPLQPQVKVVVAGGMQGADSEPDIPDVSINPQKENSGPLSTTAETDSVQSLVSMKRPRPSFVVEGQWKRRRHTPIPFQSETSTPKGLAPSLNSISTAPSSPTNQSALSIKGRAACHVEGRSSRCPCSPPIPFEFGNGRSQGGALQLEKGARSQARRSADSSQPYQPPAPIFRASGIKDLIQQARQRGIQAIKRMR